MKSLLLDIIKDNTGTLMLRLAFNLTVTARNAYVVGGGGVDKPEVLLGINEIQHRLLGRVLALNSGGYLVPEVEFSEKLVALASLYGSVGELESAIQFAHEAENKNAG